MKNEKANILVTCEKASQASIFHSPVFKEVFNLEIAYSKNDVLQKLKTNKFSILLMDVFMKEENTFDICKSIKNNYKHNKLYVILYSNIKSDIIEINSFENGADDFILINRNPKIIIAKILAIQKRIALITEVIKKEEPSKSKQITIDRDRFLVSLNDKDIFFPKKEFEILELLISKPGKVFTRKEIYERLWNNDLKSNNRTIDVHVRRIRKKLGEELLITLKGVGYKLKLAS